MSSMKYYALRYDSHDAGCPTVLSGFFNCEEFEWPPSVHTRSTCSWIM